MLALELKLRYNRVNTFTNLNTFGIINFEKNKMSIVFCPILSTLKLDFELETVTAFINIKMF